MDNIIILFVSVLSGIATYSISNILNKGAVFASALVTLISGIIFPYFFPELGTSLMIVAACASYAGMVSVKNVSSLSEMAIVSLITGTLFIISNSAYQGVGGRLGTIAALSCFAWIGIKRVFTGSKYSTKPNQLNRLLNIK